MSRHGKPAEDSARLNMIVPKTMKERIETMRRQENARSLSDASRICMEVGLQKLEAKHRR